jgi:hypothetical protein
MERLLVVVGCDDRGPSVELFKLCLEGIHVLLVFIDEAVPGDANLCVYVCVCVCVGEELVGM